MRDSEAERDNAADIEREKETGGERERSMQRKKAKGLVLSNSKVSNLNSIKWGREREGGLVFEGFSFFYFLFEKKI